MNRRDLLIFLGLELFAIFWAGLVFSTLDNKVLAGALAGSYFVISGLWMLYRAMRWPRHWSSLVIYALMMHVFGISLPMLISRFIQRDRSFADVRIAGLSGPEFHNLSSLVFSVLIVATIADWARAKWAARKAQPTGNP